MFSPKKKKKKKERKKDFVCAKADRTDSISSFLRWTEHKIKQYPTSFIQTSQSLDNSQNIVKGPGERPKVKEQLRKHSQRITFPDSSWILCIGG